MLNVDKPDQYTDDGDNFGKLITKLVQLLLKWRGL